MLLLLTARTGHALNSRKCTERHTGRPPKSCRNVKMILHRHRSSIKILGDLCGKGIQKLEEVKGSKPKRWLKPSSPWHFLSHHWADAHVIIFWHPLNTTMRLTYLVLNYFENYATITNLVQMLFTPWGWNPITLVTAWNITQHGETFMDLFLAFYSTTIRLTLLVLIETSWMNWMNCHKINRFCQHIKTF